MTLEKCEAFTVSSMDAINYTKSPTIGHDALALLKIIYVANVLQFQYVPAFSPEDKGYK